MRIDHRQECRRPHGFANHGDLHQSASNILLHNLECECRDAPPSELYRGGRRALVAVFLNTSSIRGDYSIRSLRQGDKTMRRQDAHQDERAVTVSTNNKWKEVY
ncbi:MAG: hypothetical protein EHJ95_07095 [Methanobacteriota archaeon]|nr:MAG: hypothetical protein EHJ95_07095 [Euryarchaeota archaeon]